MTIARISITGSLLVFLGFGAWYFGGGRPAAAPAILPPTARPTLGAWAKATQTRRASPRLVRPKLDPTVVERWRENVVNGKDAEIDEAQLADEDERDAMLAEDRLPEQGGWRSAWLSEEEDEGWTLAVAEELRLDGEKLAKGDVTVRDVSCRETVCRMYLEISDLDDAEAFLAVDRDPNFHYEFQLMNPELDEVEPGEEQNRKYHFEVLVAREDSV